MSSVTSSAMLTPSTAVSGSAASKEMARRGKARGRGKEGGRDRKAGLCRGKKARRAGGRDEEEGREGARLKEREEEATAIAMRGCCDSQYLEKMERSATC